MFVLTTLILIWNECETKMLNVNSRIKGPSAHALKFPAGLQSTQKAEEICGKPAVHLISQMDSELHKVKDLKHSMFRDRKHYG